MPTTDTTRLDERAVRITGGQRLVGTATVQGSKNTALHLYAATILADDPLTLIGAPEILDTGVVADILHRTGTRATVTGDEFATRPADSYFPVIPDDLGRRIRTTAVLAAALLARSGKVTFPTPGGDAFCTRHIDRHLAAMEAAGADVEVTRGRVRARITGKSLPFITDADTRSWGPSLGATITAMLLAARIPGTSSVLNPSVEPEVTHTAALLSKAGVGIEWQGRTALHVTGTDRVRGGVFPVPPDRSEAATLALAAAITGGTVHLTGFPAAAFPDGLVSVFADAGIRLDPVDGGTTVSVPAGPRAVRTATGPHPGFPTDVQPQLTAFLTQAEGTSRIDERIYPQRDTHLPALAAFGAAVNACGPVITVRGRSALTAADVAGEDIRAATALVIAALVAEGTSTIRGMYHLRLGYGSLLPKLAALGADLTIDQEQP
ncbi:UDP-N-acetylglucosamine 1-carboxyvinyltransferase [Kitasatospora sp. NA04385]|uniref:UDP-N-acetylglucosamine 1-carboxyvinyltransferase n=1 Tax=Kitasatospora sp. NA04385 TaxID=2742135 RepID=UPI00159094A8|nr:UDP-N-acetylglucosamine 1-carboxyvinyltransferase [Kitasatospora sp. NA04385]QKW19831.1 UDP-N-acetylglucosamine 1-carboxyvinyltransferase [Kitasatospora sp. NA04385]